MDSFRISTGIGRHEGTHPLEPIVKFDEEEKINMNIVEALHQIGGESPVVDTTR